MHVFSWRKQEVGLESAFNAMAHDQITDYADMFAALGSEPRLRIVRLLLSAYPDGLIVGDIQAELGIANSTLSHHLEKLRHEGLVFVQRDGNRLWYGAQEDVLERLLSFLFAECCTRNKAVKPEAVLPEALLRPCKQGQGAPRAGRARISPNGRVVRSQRKSR
jgi:ArsR family transcriptional regulator, arsenate/arsenite/antimonite-responsive transcriptional repressor